MTAVMTAVMTAMALVGTIAAVLAIARRRWPGDDSELVTQVNALLPQTQCAQCGYPGCLPYARAIALAQAPLDRCPPGGVETHAALVRLLPDHPQGSPPAAPGPVVARIDESRCIGCFLCVPACPVDAIIGAKGFMHTVLTRECTGCGLCLPPCPVDCISLLQAAPQ